MPSFLSLTKNRASERGAFRLGTRLKDPSSSFRKSSRPEARLHRSLAERRVVHQNDEGQCSSR